MSNLAEKVDNSKDPFQIQVLQKIAESIKSIKYGQVVIIVQDSQVIQIDKVEKVRIK